MALPEWVDRLRTASFVSPKGVVSTFKFDTLSRSGGKKTSIHEILNSDDAIIQEQGNRIKSYPMNIYFTGDNGDIESDTFFASLEESYTADNPGVLKHPRWGDINVIPFEFEQNENYVNTGGIFRCTVEFKESIISEFPTASGNNEAQIISGVDTLESSVDSANEAIDATNPSNYAEFRATISSVANTIGDALDPIAQTVDTVYDEFVLIQEDIDEALSIGTDALEIMSQVNKLIRLPAQIVDSTLSKIQAYGAMLVPVTNTFKNKVNPQTNRIDQVNNAIMLQSISSMITGGLIEASMTTEIETRDKAGDIIDLIIESAEEVEESVSSVYQSLSDPTFSIVNISNIFVPDHDTGLNLSDIVGQSSGYLIEKSFDLKIKKTTILTAPSDALTLTYKLYKDISQLEFLIRTNKLNDNEIIDTPAGRSIVSYA